MSPSPRIEAFIKGFEKCRLSAFKPTPYDQWTCGWGATGPDIAADTQWNQKQADDRFDTDMVKFGLGVTGLIGTATTTQDQYDAMVSLAYNIGDANFARSSVLTNHKAGHYQTAGLAFALWNKQSQNGTLVVLDGLTKRRAAEAAIYLGAAA